MTERTIYQEVSTGGKTGPANLEDGVNLSPQIEQGLDVQVAQMNVSLSAMGEKVNSFIELQKHFSLSRIAILAAIISISILVTSLIYGSISNYFNLQDKYYQLLIQDKDALDKFILNSEIRNSCAKSNSYWEFKVCLNSLSGFTK